MARIPLTIDVALAPALLRRDPARQRRTVSIVVDVIRATTTLCVLFERGCRRVEVASDIQHARAAAAPRRAALAARQLPPLLAGEVGGLAPAGFDCGNSPAEFAPLDLSDREVIFATTNGTRALHACAGDAATLVGAFRNAAAVARVAVSAASCLGEVAAPADEPDATLEQAMAPDDEDAPHGPSIVVVCAGRDQYPAFDDTVCAGYLAESVRREAIAAGHATSLGNGAQIAIAASQSAVHDGLRATLGASGAGRAIESVGLASDLDLCAEIDACPHVPTTAPLLSTSDLLVLQLWTQD